MNEPVVETGLGRWPRILLSATAAAATLALFPYTRNVAQPIKQLMMTFGVAAAAISCFVPHAVRGGRWTPPRLFSGIMLLYLGLHGVAALLSEYPLNSIVELRLLGVYAAAYLVSAQIFRRPEHLDGYMAAACTAVGVSSLYAMGQKAGFDPFPWADRALQEYRELPGTFGNANLAAHMIGVSIVLAAYLARQSRFKWPALLIPLYVVHLFWTRQRGAWAGVFGAAVLLFLFAWVGRRIGQPWKRAVVTLVLWVASGCVIALGVIGVSRAATGIRVPLDRALMIRYSGFFSAAQMIGDRPLLGCGPGNYPIVNPAYWTEYEQEHFAIENRMNYHVHNEWLQAAIDAGAPAAGLYLLLIGLAIASSLWYAATSTDEPRRRLGRAFAAFFAVVLVDGMTGFNLHVIPVGLTVFVFLGAIEGIYRDEGAVASKRSGYWGTALAAVVAVLAGFETRVFTSELYLKAGDAALFDQDGRRAERALAVGERLAPWNWEFAALRGRTALHLEDPDTARAHLERCLRRNPHYISGLAMMGRAHLMRAQQMKFSGGSTEYVLREIEAVRGYAHRIRELSYPHPAAASLFGTAALLHHDVLGTSADPGQRRALLEEARNEMTTALRFSRGRTAPNFTLLALANMRLDLPTPAQHALRSAVHVDPKERDAWRAFEEFARLYRRQRVYERSIDDAIKTLERQEGPDAAAALSRLVAARARLAEEVHGDLDVAEALYREAVRRCPTEVETWRSFAAFAQANNRRAAFKEALRDGAALLSPEENAERTVLAAVETILSRGGPGIAEAAKAIEEAFAERRRTQDRAGAALSLPAWAAEFAATEYERYGADVPDPGATLMRLAGVLADTGDLQRALQLMDKALPLLSDSDRARGIFVRDQLVRRLAQQNP